MSRLPIADYALLADSHAAALVSRDGSVDWLCLPRFDSPAVFARLLDADAGAWAVRPACAASAKRRYRPGTLVLETRWETDGGVVTVTDALAVGEGNREHELGAGAPHVLLREVRGVEGEVEMEMEFAPRPEFGLVHPRLSCEDGAVLGRGGAAVLRLSLPPGVRAEADGSVARARFAVRAGEVRGFALGHRHTAEPEPEGWSQAEIGARLADTAAAWRSWSELHQSYEGPWRELVHHSGRVLQALTYFPTGSMVAAPTTSLPETVGGERNWDYRFCWVRDASFTMEALWVAACPDEAQKFFAFLAGAAVPQLNRGVDFQVVFGVGGEHDLSERTLPHLRGWRDSAPVRVGNDAWTQRQLDTYGVALSAAHRLREYLGDMDDVTREFLRAAADAAARRWREPDHGLWEMRGEPRHFLHSKLMCWVALDRAIEMAELLRAHDRVERWAEERDEVRAAIERDGWSERAQAFTQSFGSDVLDAASLVLPLVGFLPGDDPRVQATVHAVAERLTDRRGLVFRYREDDGMEGQEGAFLLCTFWLAEALVCTGEPGRAREVFEAAAGHANDVGLLAEQVDPATRELIGNFPQAFSHIGLVNAAWAIAQAEGAAKGRDDG